MAKRIMQSFEREMVDPTTGECVKIDSQKTWTEKINPEKFYMTFLDYISPLYKLNSVSARQTLDWCCEHAQFNTGVIDLNASNRSELCETLKITNNQLTNNLKKLKELNLISGERGRFKINPEIFWKGELKVRKQALEGKSIELSVNIID